MPSLHHKNAAGRIDAWIIDPHIGGCIRRARERGNDRLANELQIGHWPTPQRGVTELRTDGWTLIAGEAGR